MLVTVSVWLLVCFGASLGSPVHREKVKSDGVRDDKVLPSRVPGEKQWKQVNKDVLPDHLEGVRLERDGKFNKEFDHEAFLGLEKKEFDGVTEDQGHTKLKHIFKLADKDGDMLLSSTELKDWIQSKIAEYFKHSHDDNSQKFKEMDINHDQRIMWNEYVSQLHIPQGTSRDVLQKAAEYHRPHSPGSDAKVNDTKSPVGKETKSLGNEEKGEDGLTPAEEIASEFLSRDQDNWEMADENQDGDLQEDEFLTFQHPEQNRRTLQGFVSDVMESMDKNGDSLLTLQEYTGLDTPKEQWSKEDEEFFNNREQEFRDMVDNNADGVVEKDELESHLDPRSEQHAYNEAMHLIALADTNKDKKLSLEEVLSNYEVFVGSPMVNVSRSFHDEF